MRRRLLLSNLVFVALLLGILEAPLALIYSRHEHDALNAGLQRDAAAVSGLSQEILEHPGRHDLAAFVDRFASRTGGHVVIVDDEGTPLTSPRPPTADRRLQRALAEARGGTTVTGELADMVFVAVPLGSGTNRHGAVFIARSDTAIDRRVHNFWLFLVALGVAALVIVALISARLAGWATRPLLQLGERAAQLGRGELHVRADASSGPPEVVVLATRFNEMADQLDRLVAAQRRFVADASHQLRTPLTALRLRLENLDPADAQTVSATRDAALEETMRLTRLVDGLLALTRAEGTRVERRPIDVRLVVTDRQEAWAPLATEHGIDLRLGESRADGRVELVPGHLEQILDNLIANAIEATPAGAAVEIDIEVDGPGIEIHVTDDGHGMAEHDRRRAFDPFWQGADGSTGSTGLGLAIVEQLARTNRGTITLLSSATGGIDAVLRFPRSP